MTAPTINDFRYRPEIDGLRAIAVLTVVLFHAGLGCPGGFVGVDVFFVISGYLITSLVWKDLESGRFTIASFWERRVRRIVPAAVAVTLATFIAGWIVLLPADFKNLGMASLLQSVGAANFFYWRDSGYFTTAADERPLLHTWSLAVEEQFYLIVPFLLWQLFHTARLRNRKSIFFVLVAGFVISLVISIDGVARYPWAAFYLLPYRAWELLLGSLIAFLPDASTVIERRSVREWAAILGLSLVLVPVFVYTKETPFPGFFALIPCSGAGLLIWATGRSDTRAITTIGTLLSLRPIVFIGLISYSLYLWHWPLFAFSKYLSLVPLSLIYRIFGVGLSFVFAILSWKFVETPFRKRTLGTTPQSMFTYTGVGIVTVLGCGLVCVMMQGFPARLNSRTLEFADARFDRPPFKYLAIEDVHAEDVIRLGSNDPALIPEVFVWGDSHAMSALPAFDVFLNEKRIAGRAATRPATAPILDWRQSTKDGMDERSIAYNRSVLTYLERHHFTDIFLIGFWKKYKDNEHYSDSFNRSLLKTVRRLVENGSRTWIVMDVPVHSFDIPKGLSRFSIAYEEISALCERPNAMNTLDGFAESTIAEIEAAGGRILDPKPRFLNPTGQHYVIQVNETALYHDDNHLSAKGAKVVLVPFLRDSLTVVR